MWSVVLLVCVLPVVTSLARCPAVCDRAECAPRPATCAAGVLDLCGCCPVCGRSAGEVCGEQGAVDGVCSPGLVCKISVELGGHIRGTETGRCEDINSIDDHRRPTDDVINCDKANCSHVTLPDCPEDSILELNPIPGHCCPHPPTCQCLPCLTSQLTCKLGQIKVKVKDGTAVPVSCCPVFECRDKDKVCAAVSCEEENNTEAVICPPDSTLTTAPRPPPLDQCCPEQERCECRPKEECHILHCDEGTTRRVLRTGTGVPGSCCDVYECVPMNGTSCLHDGVQREDGAQWFINACTECRCGRGRVLCFRLPCPHQPPPQCGVVAVPDGDCCPHCQGCLDEGGEVRALGETWEKDPCVTCSCSGEGEVFCHAQLCAARCPHPRTVPGQCCPVCDDEYTVCPPLTNCSLHCEHGQRTDLHGCPTCECEDDDVTSDCAVECLSRLDGGSSGDSSCICDDVTPSEHCPDLYCPYGHQTDDNGQWLCQCLDPPPVENPYEPPSECPSLFCLFGYDRNPENGEIICDCLDPTFKEATLDCSMLDCPFGLKRDRDNVERCECAEEAGDVHSVPANCDVDCAYGYEHNELGGVICHCRPCPVFRCAKHCVYGYQTNSRGCKICKCAEYHTEPDVTQEPPSTRARCMSVDGRDVIDGELWYDGCRRCFCNQGREMCAPLACSAPRCRYPVVRGGDCCPSCPDQTGVDVVSDVAGQCRTTAGVLLVESETWRLDACTQCICHGGEPLCQVEHCPPLLCTHPVLVPGRCCALCAEDVLPTVPSPTSHPEHVCESPSGALYPSGQAWRTNPCQSCVCRDGHIRCFSQTCPILACERTLQRKDQCCPTCLDTEFSSGPQCVVGSVVYALGESWLANPCTQCACHRSQVLCAQITCPPLHCDAPLHVTGHCCPLCTNSTHNSSGRWDEDNGHDNHTGPGRVDHHSHHVTVAVLATLTSVLILMVIILIVLLLRKRRRRAQNNTNGDVIHVANGDLSRRPKSTNLDYQGINPLIIPKDVGKAAILSENFKNGAVITEKTPLDGGNEGEEEMVTMDDWRVDVPDICDNYRKES